MIQKIFRYIYLLLSWIYLAGVIYQTYTAGLAAVTRTISWESHGEIGFLLLSLAFVQFVLIFPARLPKPAGWVSAGMFATIILQFIVISDRESTVSALHPVLALILFSLSWWLARAAFRSVRNSTTELSTAKENDA